MTEVRAPFVSAGLLASVVLVGLLAMGTLLSMAISRPAVRELAEHSRHLERLAHALRDSQERFRHTFEQAAVGVAPVSPDGSFVRVNSTFCEITGYPADELLGMRVQQIGGAVVHDVGAGRRVVVRVPLRPVWRSAKRRQLQLRNRRSNSSAGHAAPSRYP